jgi:hypothetical protein
VQHDAEGRVYGAAPDDLPAVAGEAARVKLELRQRLHDPTPDQGASLRAVVVGHTRDYGVPRNGPSLTAFHAALARLWRVALMRSSQTAFVSWERMRRLMARWLPVPHICHPYPNQRVAFATQGKSGMR